MSSAISETVKSEENSKERPKNRRKFPSSSPGEFPPQNGKRSRRNRPSIKSSSEDRCEDFFDRSMERLAAIAGPTTDLPPMETSSSEKKFSSKNRLFIGNLSPEVTKNDISSLLSKYGEFTDFFINHTTTYCFATFDSYTNCIRAKQELDGSRLKDRTLRVRLAPNSSVVKVANLSEFVTNELLYHAFQVFGEVEKARVFVNERGKSKCEGIVEFSKRGYATEAVNRCREKCFFVTNSPRPCTVEPFNEFEDCDGYSERNVTNRRNPEFLKARSRGPHFADPNSFEQEFGMRYRQLIDLYGEKEKMLRRELELEKEKLEAQFELARYDYETEKLREELRIREMEKERHKQRLEEMEQPRGRLYEDDRLIYSRRPTEPQFVVQMWQQPE